jgi:hypothetical protein
MYQIAYLHIYKKNSMQQRFFEDKTEFFYDIYNIGTAYIYVSLLPMLFVLFLVNFYSLKLWDTPLFII